MVKFKALTIRAKNNVGTWIVDYEFKDEGGSCYAVAKWSESDAGYPISLCVLIANSADDTPMSYRYYPGGDYMIEGVMA